jgi:hypothetical protein
LTAQKKQADEINYDIKQRKKRIDELSREYQILAQKYDSSLLQSNLKQADEMIQGIREDRDKEISMTQTLNHII